MENCRKIVRTYICIFLIFYLYTWHIFPFFAPTQLPARKVNWQIWQILSVRQTRSRKSRNERQTRHNCHVIMRILIRKRAFIPSVSSLPCPISYTHARKWNPSKLQSCLFDVRATVWFINHRLGCGNSPEYFRTVGECRNFLHRYTRVVIFMSECGRAFCIIPDSLCPTASLHPFDVPSRTRKGAEKTGGDRLVRMNNDCYLYRRVYAN